MNAASISVPVLLVFRLIMGFVTGYLAKCRGYGDGFLWGFFLGFVGLLVVCFRPIPDPQASTKESELPEISAKAALIVADTKFRKAPNGDLICWISEGEPVGVCSWPAGTEWALVEHKGMHGYVMKCNLQPVELEE